MTRWWSFVVLVPILVLVGTGLAHLHAAPSSTGKAIVSPIGRSAFISIAPGRADAENTFIIIGVTAHAVRLRSRSLDMNMGTTTYAGVAQADGRWQVVNVEVPMVGRWGIEVQAQNHGTWVTIGEVAYQVPFSGIMHPIHMTSAW